ncbi:metal ABC transporter substrate-binding protein [Massilia psychrophila]|jgi:zinc/manganese transport system substrate-binding protein|uniref:Zinc ABC transporter substrate-binding protein n=1 Tax=Massilia psychrophila TaxID=1603353 RepID=A0A2G8SYD7_9BURK|nr:zinc ABC transporter substrate-binding protein [Massilia psychrophila]PIL38806.1 zinc ABC transporter substrate-binding protein [Massilia psychrophila]GGE89756.1 zinc ABC transporter substrate-binding protein [Massilia psychrophila]
MKNTHQLLSALVLGACALLSASAHAATLNVLACEPEWEALTRELGGDKVKVSSATNGLQDPHRIEARPSLIARTRNADLLVCTGLELEAGWLPALVQQSGNPKIAAGKSGYFEAGSLVPRIDVPTMLDRSEGDVHAAGNPHIQQNPHNIALVAGALAKRLAELAPEDAAYFQARQRDFSARWNAAILRWEKQAAPLRNVAVVEHHKNMEYLMGWLGMHQVGTLEAKPGVEPSAAHLGELLAQLQRRPAKMVLRAGYQDARASQWLSERARIPAVLVPFTVGGDDKAKDLFSLFDVTVQRLLDANK